ncbi:hypothetical protein ASPSYDRAFT_946494 [Aspergillus sydowii CBS 593.65]|uniref:Uncharacterized protein n=1 Tax=Aspergillus sydowii CBS 593.65 TaxID=1036612 RepID=A0A1L9TG99_9EURO|nr:uncharacterized protein ASPSYDRAFT_946494 [Aspergillus sydowii CBS 593.65]OJJ58448.1 hypothetical protein ASPSYDRAFT_946494 [Aspergillus sydowii CBS 593.65]
MFVFGPCHYCRRVEFCLLFLAFLLSIHCSFSCLPFLRLHLPLPLISALKSTKFLLSQGAGQWDQPDGLCHFADVFDYPFQTLACTGLHWPILTPLRVTSQRKSYISEGKPTANPEPFFCSFPARGKQGRTEREIEKKARP